MTSCHGRQDAWRISNQMHLWGAAAAVAAGSLMQVQMQVLSQSAEWANVLAALA